ncbi:MULTISPECIES: hypothetical protein [Auritidibacter]|uniref:Uncharacterized protein n=1 Tax=Auritidibacter ignavus TaxID=678932 RepID=A0AAJ6AQE1_9MICC|nr:MULTISPECIES: hypothetical protein [Auritidibacter]AXR74078.1 hypothetical protein DCC27_006955 [Auritidibacter sp. NML130574]PXA76270.1 hypothetical protein DCC24_08010 [Auritidibacter sp. NML100628]PXA79558.1 hypothetical protein DCC25_08645 [Auritidibacter sp. NML120636]WGH94421.1 hypothetical protein QDX21_06495 [Auritidibacter ignavus]
MSNKTSASSTSSRTGSLSQLVLWLLAALIATYAGSALPLPYKVVTPIFGIAGVVVAVVLFRGATQVKTTMLTWLAGTAGALGCVLFTAIAVAQMILWAPTQDYEQCLHSAITHTAVSECDQQYSDVLHQLRLTE